MTTIRDVAKLAGVSTATVSRVLQNLPYVSPLTREQVWDAIHKLNYQPNLQARNLRTNETKFVFVVIPDIMNPFFSRIIRGIEAVAHKAGYTMLLCDTHNDPNRELAYINILHQRGADGLIFLTARVDSHRILRLATSKPMVLACEYVNGLPVHSVSIDNLTAAFEATQHLIQLGHRRIGLINGPSNVTLCQDRRMGWQLALQQAGLACGLDLCREGPWSYEAGRAGASALLKQEDPPTALLCTSDEIAIAAINEAVARGLQVPSDLSVVGFDDIAFASMYRPALTTVAQPMEEIGKTAMRLLLEVMREPETPPRRVVLPHRLMIRESTGAARSD